MQNNIRTLDLGQNDVALILKEDGNLEVSLPDNIDMDSESVFIAAALTHALGDPELSEMIFKAFVESCEDEAPTDNTTPQAPFLHAVK